MTRDDPERDDAEAEEDQFSELLAAYDEALAAGQAPEQATLPPELAERFAEAQACLRDLEQHRRALQEPGGTPHSEVTPVEALSLDGQGGIRQVGRWQFLRELGRGGSGIVYLAWDPLLHREVAVKVPRPEVLLAPELRRRFLREAQAAAGFEHPNLVPVYEAGEVGAFCYIVSGYCRGTTLGTWLKQQDGFVAPRVAANLVAALSDAVAYIHRRSVLHRDIKPNNILLTSPEATAPEASATDHRRRTTDTFALIPKLTDFGLAKQARQSGDETKSGTLLGTPLYMAPEQAEGRVRDIGPHTDIYALGVLLYELLTGRPPFLGDTDWAVRKQIAAAEPVPPRRVRLEVPRDLETICLKCLQKDPRQRYASAAALGDDLRRFLDGRPILARPSDVWERSAKWAKRRPAVAALLGVSIVSALSLLIGTVVYSSHLQAAKELTETQRKEAVGNLYQSLVREARALRLARRDGYRRQVSERLRAALELETPEKNPEQLRQEAVACMGDYVGLEPAIWNEFSADVSVIALHPQGDQLALGLSDGTVLIRDLANGTDVARLQAHRSRVHALAFGQGGRPLVSADGAGTIQVWEPTISGTWTLVRTLTTDPPGKLWRSFVRHVSLAISPDGKRLASCSEGASRVCLWNLADGAREADFNGGDVRLHYIAWSSDGRILAAGYDDRAGHGILVWNVATQEVRRRLSRDLDRVLAVEFSADNQFLACGCDAGVAVFDTSQFQQQGFGRGDVHCSIAFSPRAPLLALPCWQLGQVRVWDFSANRDIAVLTHPVTPHSVVFSKDGRKLISADERTVRIWNLFTDEKLALPTQAGKLSTPAFNFSGNVVYVRNNQKVVIWNPASNALIWESAVSSKILRTIAASPDGRLLATGNIEGRVQLWDVPSGNEWPGAAGQVGVRDGLIFAVQFSHDGKYLAACGESGLGIFQVVDGGSETCGRLVAVASPSQGTVQACCFSPTENLLAWVERGFAARGSHTVHLWDLEKGRERTCRVPRLASHLRSLAFFPDGERLVFVNERDEIEVWKVAGDQSVSCFGRGELQPGGGMGTLALSADGAWLAVGSGGGGVTVWNVPTQKLQLVLPQERSTIMSLAWSPDNANLLLGYLDGSSALWNIPRVRAQLAELGLDW